MSYIPEVIPPIASLLPFCGPAAPDGWLWCWGQAISRVDYANLFSQIQDLYGGGDGVSTFNVPDLRGRSPIGSGQGAGLTHRNEGEYGGEEAHILTNDEHPTHYHWEWGGYNQGAEDTYNNPGNDYYLNLLPFDGYISTKTPCPNLCCCRQTNTQDWWGYYINRFLTVPENNQGGSGITGGEGHNTMQPFLVISGFIIKT